MPGSYTADEQSAAKLLSAIADDPDELIVGVITKSSDSTTAVLEHGLTGAPDFLIYSLQGDAGAIAHCVPVTTSTSVTFTLTSSTSSWSVAYIIGYTA